MQLTVVIVNVKLILRLTCFWMISKNLVMYGLFLLFFCAYCLQKYVAIQNRWMGAANEINHLTTEKTTSYDAFKNEFIRPFHQKFSKLFQLKTAKRNAARMGVARKGHTRWKMVKQFSGWIWMRTLRESLNNRWRHMTICSLVSGISCAGIVLISAAVIFCCSRFSL